MLKAFGLVFTFLTLCSCHEPTSDSIASTLSPHANRSPASPITPGVQSKGVRIDPSYFYNSHPGQSPTQIATDVITTLKNAKANTIYLYAYNSVYGAFYPTTYSNTSVESDLGVHNIFGALVNEAHTQGLKVVAVVPLNNFKKAWQNNSSWRVKNSGGYDYLPVADTYLLSASVTAYKNWYSGFIDDLVAHNPNIDAVEAVEPTLDFLWTGAPDQNSAALSLFTSQFPTSAVGTSNDWRQFRAQQFTNLMALFNQTVHANNKESYVVQTWTIKSDGTLMDSAVIKKSSGFDFIGIATLSGSSKTDHIISEFIWQQWFSEYGTNVFNPEWISSIGNSFITTLKNAGSPSDFILHVEISNFSGAYNSTTPTLSEFARTINAVKTLNAGISVYDYNQIRTRSAFNELSQW
jgi:hypothetical protein